VKFFKKKLKSKKYGQPCSIVDSGGGRIESRRGSPLLLPSPISPSLIHLPQICRRGLGGLHRISSGRSGSSPSRPTAGSALVVDAPRVAFGSGEVRSPRPERSHQAARHGGVPLDGSRVDRTNWTFAGITVIDGGLDDARPVDTRRTTRSV